VTPYLVPQLTLIVLVIVIFLPPPMSCSVIFTV
jgi:hypothetical protein